MVDFFKKAVLARTVLKALIFLIVVVSCSFIGFQAGAVQQRAVSYNLGYKEAKQKYDKPNPKSYFSEYTQLGGDYNKLVSDYNKLRDEVIKYIGATQFQQRQSISLHCSSFTYGMNNQYTSTNCY